MAISRCFTAWVVYTLQLQVAFAYLMMIQVINKNYLTDLTPIGKLEIGMKGSGLDRANVKSKGPCYICIHTVIKNLYTHRYIYVVYITGIKGMAVSAIKPPLRGRTQRSPGVSRPPSTATWLKTQTRTSPTLGSRRRRRRKLLVALQSPMASSLSIRTNPVVAISASQPLGLPPY